MKKIPIGVDDFKEIINNDFYYIDKTKFIADILNDGAKVKLFTRPRRFGKTLNMSTLKYFFDIENKNENRKLFSGLDIEKSKYISEQGQYPVIFISMKGVKAQTWKDCLSEIKILLRVLYEEFSFVKEVLSPSEQIEFDKVWFKKDDGEYSNALKNLTAYLYKYYKKEVILLIDEYDNPLITAYEYHYYDDALPFFKVFYGEALKTNPYLKMGVMTGIIRVIKAGIFSDLNNLRVYSILSKQYSDFFGFTQNEVENALKDFNIEYELPDVKIWYDGYKFGNSEVYNPWSILNFLEDRELEAYWVGTSNNFLINDILKNINSEINDSLEKLFNGERIEEIITGNSDLFSLLSYHEIWELLLFSGYLTIDKKIDRKLYSLRIPNKEINELFKDEFINVNFGESLFRNTMEALKKNKIEGFEKYLQNILLKSTSYYDTSNEDFYHGLILGMTLHLDRDYYVTSNRESGLGRYDVIIEPKNKNNRGFILEFKVVKDEKEIDKVSKEAIEQIIDKKYDTSLKERGIKDITLVGIAFFGKILKVSHK
ncbi:ATP-binding protein [Fusobacterium simiae]|uniref:ATP-binding protein n=1 Tax=Fusobacterium simiae TaxID=855 RepID=A0ABT4DKD3_FUSSI|nr:ATP-binding protein [Fusobacterium simiae]MCY7009050.1 ATP-binding protein [Fusobacterium simiae]